ncbi:MAG: hypothetical protein FWD41_00425 [Actinomycetia bacterium]|nr:hypothetical protein [Actinomycetes bacterium]
MGYFDDSVYSDPEHDPSIGKREWAKDQKLKTLVLFILYALPIPLSLASWIGTVMALAGFRAQSGIDTNETITAIVALIAMLLAGSYPLSYVVSLVQTLRTKALSWISALPVLHIVLTLIFLFIWLQLDG